MHGAVVVGRHASIGSVRTGAQNGRRGRCVGQHAILAGAVLALTPVGRELDRVAAAGRVDGAHGTLGGRGQTVHDIPIGGDAATSGCVALL